MLIKIGAAVKDGRDVEVVPIPKMGDLMICDNWRGINEEVVWKDVVKQASGGREGLT